MMDQVERFVSLFQRLNPEQREDVLKLMETWVALPPTPPPVRDSATPESAAIRRDPSLSKEWHCLSALKRVVSDYFSPVIELGYIAFHPNLDTISTAKTREAAEQMYLLEAAYELKRLLETSPESDILTEELKGAVEEALTRTDLRES
ncbi:MAG: hypothetical protein IRY98_07000 [Alicyclobacillaceae bacterium]|nr:hypothetical protein [Alicyclobacillaceae bacterium]